MSSFCTVINCMDGRTQLPVINYMLEHFSTDYVDSVTEAGPIAILAEQPDGDLACSILSRVNISVNKHGSSVIAIVAHYDCAGNPVDKPSQLVQLASSVKFISSQFPQAQTIGLWVDESWIVTQID